MADVGSVTNFNSSLPNPLATLTSVMGIANTAQQNQLLQTANQQRQLQLQQGFADDLLGTVAPLVNKPGVTQAEVLGTLASRARNFGPNGQPAYDIAAQRYQGPDWQNNLKLDATRATGNANILSRTGTVDQSTGLPSSVPSVSTIGSGLPTGLPLTAAPSTEKMQKDLTDVGNFPEQIAPLMQMHKEISSLPEGSMGPLTTGLLHTEI